MKRVSQIILVIMIIIVFNASSAEAITLKRCFGENCNTMNQDQPSNEEHIDESPYVVPEIRQDTVSALVNPWYANLARRSGYLDPGYCPLTGGVGWDGALQWPVPGAGIRPGRHFKETSNHRGIDIEAPLNSAVYAAENGIVVWAGKNGFGWGNTVITAHGGYTIVYAHLTDVYVGCGDYVSDGQNIGTVGVSGNTKWPHLHLEVRVGDSMTEAKAVSIDPRRFLRGG